MYLRRLVGLCLQLGTVKMILCVVVGGHVIEYGLERPAYHTLVVAREGGEHYHCSVLPVNVKISNYKTIPY